MKRRISSLLLALILCILVMMGCGEKSSVAGPGEKRDPVYTVSGETVSMDCGSFTVEYPSSLSEVVKDGTIVSNKVFLEIAVPVNDSPVSSNLCFLRSDEMKGVQASQITQEQANAYAQAAAKSFSQEEAQNVTLEKQKVGDREMAVVAYQINYSKDQQELYSLYCKQYILPMEDCGYVILLAAIDEPENATLNGVMDTLTLAKK